MKVEIDRELCSGDAICTDLCPDVFEMEDDKAKVIVDVVPPDSEECVRDAVESCTEGCITIIE